MNYLVQWFTATEKGNIREVNEDAVLTHPDRATLEQQPDMVPPGGRLCVVADGLGDHAGGQRASSLAITLIRDHYYSQRNVSTEQSLVGSTTKYRGRYFTVGCVRFSTKSKNAHTPPEWGLRGNCVPSCSSVSTPLRILHGILWCYHLEKVRNAKTSFAKNDIFWRSWRLKFENLQR